MSDNIKVIMLEFLMDKSFFMKMETKTFFSPECTSMIPVDWMVV
jgi:hypothetical protein